METSIQKLAVICFLVIGVSHILQPRVWAQFFIDLRSKGAAGSFINAFIHFPLGVLIVAFHNVWQGIPIILTLIGYSLVLKSLFYFVMPATGLKAMSRVSLEKSWEFVVAGIVSVIIAGVLLFSLLTKS
jgi:CDP-diglyceride synthetase